MLAGFGEVCRTHAARRPDAPPAMTSALTWRNWSSCCSDRVVSSDVKRQLPQTLVNCLKRKLQTELDKAWVTKTAANHSKPVGRIVPP